MKKKTATLQARQAESASLTAQLERQLSFESQYGIKPHDIAKIRKIPAAAVLGTVTAWDSLVTMRNGVEYYMPGVDAKTRLDGTS